MPLGRSLDPKTSFPTRVRRGAFHSTASVSILLATDLHCPQKKLPALGAEDLQAVRQDLGSGGWGVQRSRETKGIVTSTKGYRKHSKHNTENKTEGVKAQEKRAAEAHLL